MAGLGLAFIKAGHKPYYIGNYHLGSRFYFKDSDGIEFEVVSYA